ncbi:hypothetical protein [Sphingobium sp. KCTC 72723]|uniref:hypothetical protein n=1 Tax=Sphingobium sp. KCTC 72723 TaxID=2733867 RepID=UPI00165D3679|nr:hypothetical protein [Sphingobium sp. KCTC 72723]
MSHFWLKPDEQALMDSATATAHDYGYIGAFDIGTATKTALKKLLGYEAKPEDQIRPHKLVNQTRYCVSTERRRPNMRVKVLVRVTKNQAMRLKLSLTDDDLTARLMDDPTGEYWGNLLISQSHLPSKVLVKDGYGARWHVIMCLQELMKNEGFGPTLERVSTFADALPVEWRAAFVLTNFSNWSRSHSPYDFFNRQRGKLNFADQKSEDNFFNGIFDEPITKCGQSWATDFWRMCQNAEYRQKVGIGA